MPAAVSARAGASGADPCVSDPVPLALQVMHAAGSLSVRSSLVCKHKAAVPGNASALLPAQQQVLDPARQLDTIQLKECKVGTHLTSWLPQWQQHLCWQA